APCIQKTSLRAAVESSRAIFEGIDVKVNGADVSVAADRVQLEQVLINVLRNGMQSTGATQLLVCWKEGNGSVIIEIADDGAGIVNRENLFIPFYTTKKDGNGIGLALARQIMDAHGGRIDLDNRVGVRGAVARIELPLF
ncbi:TPA: histidine kinase, partial [Stenotrophomonas maltophilia]|nr:histidine kinase [Stenotrophomonas maltophilia]